MVEDKDWLEPDEDAPELEEVPEDEDELLSNVAPLGADRIETIKQIQDAKKKSKQRAGMVKSTEDGSTLEEDEPQYTRIPESGIHEFENIEECVCDCHPAKKDCMNCYDHPIHLEKKRKMFEKPKDEYDEAKIMELIEADKAKSKKKWFWSKQ